MKPPRVRTAWDKWYGTARWQRRRRHQLRSYPLCAMCEAQGIITPACIVDHVTPHKGSRTAFELSAVQSLCEHCHNSTKKEIENKGYSTAIGPDGWPTDERHPAYAKRF